MVRCFKEKRIAFAGDSLLRNLGENYEKNSILKYISYAYDSLPSEVHNP